MGLTIQIVIAMVLGLVLGPLLGAKAMVLGEISKLMVNLIKTVATPLLFLAIIDSIGRAHMDRKGGLRLIFVAIFNASLAMGIGLALSNIFSPGQGVFVQNIENSSLAKSIEQAGGKIDFAKAITGWIPVSVVEPFVSNNMVAIILIAIGIGIALRRLRNHAEYEEGVERFLVLTKTGFGIFEQLILGIVRLTPFAVFGAIAKTVGEFGYTPILGLGKYVGVALLGMMIHVFVVYFSWIKLFAKRSWMEFLHHLKAPAIYSVGANSSLATLPLTLKALKDLKVSDGNARLGACVGTNLNNDGIMLYEAMAVLFVGQIYGLDFTLSDQVMIAISCAVAAVGIAGVPEAGIISLALVLGTVKLPTDILPMLVSVDWIVARARSATNVASDMVVSIVLDAWEKKSNSNKL